MSKNFKSYKLEVKNGIIGKCNICGKSIKKSQQSIHITTDLASKINDRFEIGKYHGKCIMIKNYFIGFIDILGFSKEVMNKDLDEIYEIMNTLIDCASKSKVRASVSRKEITIAEIRYIIFSDSIFAFKEVPKKSDPKVEIDLKKKTFHEFCGSIYEIYQEAFKNQLHLRMGISYGKAIIQIDDLFKNNIIIGKPIIEAYKVESMQKWMGIGFHNSLKSFIEKSEVPELIEYDIPKKKENGLSNFTINWVDSNLEKFSDEFFDNWIVSCEKEEQYKLNTYKFYSELKKSQPPLRHIG